MILALWTSKRGIPYITYCENETPIFSVEFRTNKERDNFVAQQRKKHNLIIKGE